MSVLEDIYHGNLYPEEKIIPKTELYLESKKEAIELTKELQKQLTAEQFELFEQYCNAKAIMSREMYCESFRQGVILGARLQRELQGEEREDNAPEDVS